MSAAPHDIILENGRFQIDIVGIASSKMVMQVDIDPMTVDIQQVTSGDNAGYRQIKPGSCKFGTATFVFHVDEATQNSDLQNWVKLVAQGSQNDIRKTISVNFFDRTKTQKRSFTLGDCFPILFDRGDLSTDAKVTECKLQVQIGMVTLA